MNFLRAPPQRNQRSPVGFAPPAVPVGSSRSEVPGLTGRKGLRHFPILQTKGNLETQANPRYGGYENRWKCLGLMGWTPDDNGLDT